MANCKKCGAVLEEGAAFCGECGARVPVEAICPLCGAKIDQSFTFCTQCGCNWREQAARVKEPVENEGKVETHRRQPILQTQQTALVPVPIPSVIPEVRSKETGRLARKKWTLIGAGALALAVISVVLFFILRPKAPEERLLYFQDYEMLFTSVVQPGEGTALTDNLNAVISSTEKPAQLHDASSLAQFSEDGSLVYYLDDIRSDGQSCTLYCRDLTLDVEDKNAITKIDTGVIGPIMVYDGGHRVIYIKKTDQKLYVSDREGNQVLVATGVQEARLSDDKKRMLFWDKNDGLYLCELDKPEAKEKLDSSVGRLVTAGDNFDSVTYIKDQRLYVKKVDEDRREIVLEGDLEDISPIYGNGAFYYTVKNAQKEKLADYMEDDCAQEDTSLKQPVLSDFQKEQTETDEEGHTTTKTVTDYEAYYKAKDSYWEKYYQKETRDTIRRLAAETEIVVNGAVLYYYDGEKSVELGTLHHMQTFAEEKAVMVYALCDSEQIQKIKLSQVTSIEDFSRQAEEAVASALIHFYALEGRTQRIEEQLPSDEAVCITKDGSAIYYLAEYDTSLVQPVGTLMRLDTASGQTQRIDGDICSISFGADDSGQPVDRLFYVKNKQDNGVGDLYIDGNLVAEQVNTNRVVFYTTDCFYYYTDWNERTSTGTLHCWKNGNNTDIAENTADILVKDWDDFFYLSMDSTGNAGVLYHSQKGNTDKVAENVNGMGLERSYHRIALG